MKAAALTGHYPALTATERLALLLAAHARGDEAEQHRLMATAPRVGYRVPHTFGRLMALHEILSHHRMRHLDLAAMFLWTLAQSDAGDTTAERLLGIARKFAYLLKAHADGLARFRDWLGLDTSALESSLPGCDTILRAGELAAAAPATEAEVAGWARQRNPDAQVPTAESNAAGLMAMYQELVGLWE